MAGLGVVPCDAALAVHPEDLEQLRRHLPHRRRAAALHEQQQLGKPALARRRRHHRTPVTVPVAHRPQHRRPHHLQGRYGVRCKQKKAAEGGG